MADQPNRPPNFLFFLPDQHRPDWLGMNPDLPLRTPNLDRLASRGTRFTNAFTPSPVCSPARACLATGRDYEHCGVPSNGQNTPLSLPNHYRHLQDAGYEVVGVGKFDLHKPDRDWGLDGSNQVREYGFTRGIDNEGKGDAISAYQKNDMSPKGPYMQFLLEEGLVDAHYGMYEPRMKNPGWLNYPAVAPLPEYAYCDNWVAANGIDFLRDLPADKPWYLVVNFVGPHGPFDVTQNMRSRWENVDIPEPNDNDQPDREAIRDRRQNYAAMIENIDRLAGEMMEVVKERRELENTVVVYSSDHGEMLGDHNRWGKTLWYTPSAGIPLIAAGPGIGPNATSDALVSLHDLAATFLDYADADPLPDADALSLRPVLEGNATAHREHLVSALGDWRMAFDGRYKLVLRKDQSPLLYDIEADPLEDCDIAGREPGVVERLRSLLA